MKTQNAGAKRLNAFGPDKRKARTINSLNWGHLHLSKMQVFKTGGYTTSHSSLQARACARAWACERARVQRLKFWSLHFMHI
ncbi:hypothetical protein ACQKRQ_34290 [Paraburkholderia sp. NPDC080076]|uniref:hypothetical protein n=1 Tax=Paraburkholderia sp. NPDC080076 TaxID=3390605 RepID=UPI003CFC234C